MIQKWTNIDRNSFTSTKSIVRMNSFVCSSCAFVLEPLPLWRNNFSHLPVKQLVNCIRVWVRRKTTMYFSGFLYIKILFEMNIFCEYQRRNSWLCPIFIAGYCRDVLITILFRETKLYTNFLSRFSKWQHLIQVLVILQLQRNATWFTTELHKQITFRKISRISFRIYEKQLPLE